MSIVNISKSPMSIVHFPKMSMSIFLKSHCPCEIISRIISILSEIDLHSRLSNFLKGQRGLSQINPSTALISEKLLHKQINSGSI